MSKLAKITVFSIISCLFIFGCKQDIQTPSRDSINIFLPSDPQSLNPVYGSKQIGREVFQYLYVPVGDFHPTSLDLYPILLKNLPKAVVDDKGEIYYEVDLIEDAKWADGQKITGEDYVFTIKSVLLPQTTPKAWKSVLKNMYDISVDKDDPYKLNVYVNNDYMLAKEMISTVILLPKHSYPNSSVLDNLSIAEITAIKDTSSIEGLSKFVTDFNDPKHYTTDILGNGPYKVDAWETDQFLKLSKQENYWGEKYKDNPFLQANVATMNFKIIADEMTAITAFKDGALDVIKGLPAINFESLKKDNPDASFLNSPSSRFYYISINNQKPALQEVATRKALAKLIDVQGLIKNLELGYGTPLNGPILPNKKAYNEKLSDITFNIEEAKELLNSAGWEDSNNNKIIDKIIEGKREELELDLLVTKGKLGQKVALVFQEEAAKVGIKINVITKDIRTMLKENIYPYNYDLAALAESQDVVPLDPYRRWHSDNIKENGSNSSGFQTAKSDSLITLIRNEKDVGKREDLYETFHKEIYDQQAVIFLFSPTEKLVVSPGFEATVTAKRPGYLANTFKIKSAKK